MTSNVPRGKITEHFSYAELACHCGECEGLPEQLGEIERTAQWLEDVRTALGGHPVHLNSAWRCAKHNREVGGASGSFHMQGKAADIVVRDLSPATVQKVLISHWGEGKLIKGLGSGRGFTHVDRRPGEPAKWRY